MLASSVPRLEEVIATAVSDTIHSATDSWIRVQLPRDWPVQDALRVVAQSERDLAVGVLSPFAKADFAGLTASDVPATLTDWRTTRTRARKPTVIVGDADGPEEAGLREAPFRVTYADILARWRYAINAWCKAKIHAVPAGELAAALIDAAGGGDIDARRLDLFLADALVEPTRALEQMRVKLWMVSLCPDQRAVDPGATSRVRINISLRDALLAPTDLPGDARRLARLIETSLDATKPVDQGVARAALQYRDTRDYRSLAGVELDVLERILAPSGRDGQPRPLRPLDFFDFLDELAAVKSDERARALAELGEAWDLSAEECQDLGTTIQYSDGTTREVRIRVTPSPASAWTGADADSQQCVAVMAGAQARHDWLPWPPEGERVLGERLRDAAQAQDVFSTTTEFAQLAEDYLAARSAFRPLERWLRLAALPLMVLRPNAREVARDFLGTWNALVSAALNVPLDGTDVIRGVLLRLEAVWGRDGERTSWCVLGPFHPYIIDPILQLADFCVASLGTAGTGRRVAWALDRTVPAYRVLWTTDATLFIHHEDGAFEFGAESRAQQLLARSGRGVADVARAFLDYHPHARDTLVVTLIDPPRGGAVQKNLQAIARHVQRLRVYVVTTRADSAHLDITGDDVHFLGRFRDIHTWLEKAPVRAHLVFFFSPRQGGASAAAATHPWGPTAGAHVAVKVDVRNPDFLESGSRLTPFVSFEPRDKNRVVVGLQALTRRGDEQPRLFEVEPMLSDTELAQFARLRETSDWTVLGAPTPLGLVPAREIGQETTYIGRESLGVYGLFVYASSLFAIRRLVSTRLKVIAVDEPSRQAIEERIAALALESANGVLRMGQETGNAFWQHVGLVLASELARRVDQ